MRLIRRAGDAVLLRIDRGEEILGSLRSWCADNGVSCGSFSAIGAARSIVLAWYDVETKTYEKRQLEDQHEIVSLLGNVSLREGQVWIHAHGCFSDREMCPSAGHVVSAVVSATCEVALRVMDGTADRAHDDVTGLWLLCPAA